MGINEIEIDGKKPVYDKNKVFIANNVVLIGDIEIGDGSSIWFNSVIRADLNKVKIGENTNIQDNCVIHVDFDAPVSIGNGVTVGHNAIIHGAKIGDNVLIGMGSTIMSKVEIGEFCIVGANALVTPNTKIEPYSLYLGVPAVFKRKITEKEIEYIKESAKVYCDLAYKYLSGRNKSNTYIDIQYKGFSLHLEK
jgi:carbonic anhydrase/acetyltransferase-like protein (isoleucine patch superfamily)